MKNHARNNEISISTLWKVARDRIWYLLIALLVGVGLGFCYSQFLVTPMYSSTAEFIVRNNKQTTSSYLQGTDMLTTNYVREVQGNVLVGAVTDSYNAQYGTHKTVNDVMKQLKVEKDADASSFLVKISSSDPAEAYNLLNAFSQHIKSEFNKDEDISVNEITKGVQATKPDTPNFQLNMVLFGLGCMVVTYLVFFFISVFDKTMYSEQSLKENFEIPVLGVIPEWLRPGEDVRLASREKRNLKKSLKNGQHLPRDIEGRLLGSETPFSITEAFATLRTNLTYAVPRNSETPVFAVVSDFSGTGKSLVSANIALSFALLHKKVLLIDGDMRCPVLHNMFGVAKGQPGLSEALAGVVKDPLQSCVVSTKAEGLDLMVCGHIPPNPNELVASVQMRDLITKARETYDYIFLDMPPVCVTSDAGVLASLATGYVLVARAAYSNISTVLESVDNLEAVQANIIGFVVNDIDLKQGSRYYSSRHRYTRYGRYYGARAKMASAEPGEQSPTKQENDPRA